MGVAQRYAKENELISLFVDRKTIHSIIGRIGKSRCAIEAAERQLGIKNERTVAGLNRKKSHCQLGISYSFNIPSHLPIGHRFIP